ncbi:MAG: PAS domain S-box protein [Actinomycetota bacterium]
MSTGESPTDENPIPDAGRPAGPLTREILDHISDAVVGLDRELRVIFLNQQAREYLLRLGVERPDAGGQAFWDALLGPIDPEARAGILNAAQEQSRAQYEVYFAPLQRWLECRVHPSPSGVTLVARDITARREAELELAESAGRLQLAMDSANLGDWHWDAATDEVRLSERAAAILGHPERTQVTWAELRQTLHPDDRERAREAVERAAASRADYQIHYRRLTPGQPDRWISAKGRGVYNSQGQVTGMLGVVQDVTAEKQAETELRSARTAAEHARVAAEERAAELQAQREEYETLCDELSSANMELVQREVALREASSALRASEERFRQVAETIREVFWLSTPDKQQLLYVSPAYEELWGHSRESLYRSPASFLEAVHPDDRSDAQEAVRNQTLGEATDATYRVIRPDGSVRWVRDRAFPLRDEAGNVFRVAGIAEDITERKLAEEARHESEALSSQVFESSLDSISVLDPQGSLLSMNACGLRGLECADPAELLHTSWLDLWGEDRAQAEQALETARGGGMGSFVGFCPTRRGTPKWWDVVVSPILGLDGNPERLLAISRDITETRGQEVELREQSRIIEAVNRTARVLAGELDLQKLLQAITDAATEVSDAQFGSFFYNVLNDGGEAYMLYTLSGVPREAFSRFPMPRNTAIFAPTFRGEGVVRLDNVLEDPRYGKSAPYHGMPEGHLPVRSYLAVPVISRSGEVLGGLFFGHSDIGVFTERHERILIGIAAQAAIAIDNARLYKQAKDAEYASRQHAEELAEANRRKDEFISMLSHELRNPLGAISNAVAVIQQPGVPPGKAAHLTGVIERQTRNLSRMVDDLLDVSRLLHGMIELRLERIDLSSVLTRAVESCRDALDARGHRLTVSVDLEPVMLEADPTRLEQILCNLLDNAAKYTEAGGAITVTAEYEEREEQPQVVFRIKDSGIGISPELLPRIFDLFTQAERSLDRAQGGLGIGLTVVLRLVELHGGTIQAFSEGAGKGSEFVVRLPALPVERQPRPETAAHGAPKLRPMRVLVVDDLVDAAESLQDLLEAWGQEVQLAHTGPAALLAAEEFRPHVVLLDLGLPGWDGFEVARRLRELPEGDSLRLIAVTGYGQEEDVRRTSEAGFTAHLTKPVDVILLQQTLAQIGAEPLVGTPNPDP